MLLNTATLDAAADRDAFTGLVAVDVGDRHELLRTYGFAHRALGVEHAAETRYGIASGSKSFTALAVMRLVEDGTLHLTQTARSILGDDLPQLDDRVTIEHLLTHTSGIGDYLDEEADWDAVDYVLEAPVHTLTTAEAFLPLMDLPPSFVPGERFAYCNGGYIVLAILLERVCAEPFHAIVRREVFHRAGLLHTDFLRLDELPGTAALGYLFDEGDRVNTLHLPVLGNGDGGAFTTAGDLHRFWTALLSGDIVSPETLNTMLTPRHDVPSEGLWYGLGFWMNAGGTAFVLEGYDAGVSFRSTHVPSARLTASVLGNSTEGAWPVIGVVADAVDAFLETSPSS
jgi:CubicO group peptidase (beta-lactamase class C family)